MLKGVDYVNVGCTLMSSWLCCHNHNDFWLNIWFCFCKCSGWTDEGVLGDFVIKHFKLKCFSLCVVLRTLLSLLFTALRFVLHQAGLKALLGLLVLSRSDLLTRCPISRPVLHHRRNEFSNHQRAHEYRNGVQ